MPPEFKVVGELAESGVAQQLREGFRGLRFESALEQEFRTAHLLALRRQLRRNLLLAMVLILAFALLDRWLLGLTMHSASDMLRFAVILPLISVTLGVTYSDAYTRWYPNIVRICAPICGVCVVAIVAPAVQAGTQLLFATLVITTMYMYFLVGMLFYAALMSNLFVLTIYIGIDSGIGYAGKGSRLQRHAVGAYQCRWRRRLLSPGNCQPRRLSRSPDAGRHGGARWPDRDLQPAYVR